jgi:hypothetical protein
MQAAPPFFRHARPRPAVLLPLVAALLAGCQAQMPRLGAQPVAQTVQCQPPAAPGAGARAADTGPALVQQAYGTAHTPIPVNAVLFTHEGLAAHVAVQALYAGRTEGGTVHVTARLVNCADQPIVLRARTSFLQPSTAPAEPASAWQNVFLPPRATALYQERSMARDTVASYLIEIAPAP